MIDKFKNHATNLESPGEEHFAVVPDDDNDLPYLTRVLYCTEAGSAVIVDQAGNEVTYAAVAAGIFPFRAARIKATGTTATFVGWQG